MPDTVPQAQGEYVIQNPPRDVEDFPEGRCIANKAKTALKQLVSDELATLVEGSLDDILPTSFHSAQSGTRQVVYNVMEQIIPDELSEVVIGYLDAHIAKILDTYATADRVLKKLLTSSIFMAQIATSVQRNSDTTTADQKRVIAKASKKACGSHGSIW